MKIWSQHKDFVLFSSAYKVLTPLQIYVILLTSEMCERGYVYHTFSINKANFLLYIHDH